MTTVEEVRNRVKNIQENIIALQASISDSYTKYVTGGLTNQGIKFNSQIRDLKEEADKYDTEFREHERYLQQSGGKTRHQTLQEFVLLFFWTSFTLLGISLAIFSYTSTKNITNSLKILGLIAFIGLIVTAIIIRYA